MARASRELGGPTGAAWAPVGGRRVRGRGGELPARGVAWRGVAEEGRYPVLPASSSLDSVRGLGRSHPPGSRTPSLYPYGSLLDSWPSAREGGGSGDADGASGAARRGARRDDAGPRGRARRAGWGTGRSHAKSKCAQFLVLLVLAGGVIGLITYLGLVNYDRQPANFGTHWTDWRADVKLAGTLPSRGQARSDRSRVTAAIAITMLHGCVVLALRRAGIGYAFGCVLVSLWPLLFLYVRGHKPPTAATVDALHPDQYQLRRLRRTEKLRFALAPLAVTYYLYIAALLVASQWSYTWDQDTAKVQVLLHPFADELTNCTMGMNVGLRGVNYTLTGEPTHQQEGNIVFNEHYSWLGGQGRNGHGKYSGLYNRQYRERIVQGVPLPISELAEYLVFDQERIRWGRQYRLAGYFTRVILWLAFALWGVAGLFFILSATGEASGGKVTTPEAADLRLSRRRSLVSTFICTKHAWRRCHVGRKEAGQSVRSHFGAEVRDAACSVLQTWMGASFAFLSATCMEWACATWALLRPADLKVPMPSPEGTTVFIQPGYGVTFHVVLLSGLVTAAIAIFLMMRSGSGLPGRRTKRMSKLLAWLHLQPRPLLSKIWVFLALAACWVVLLRQQRRLSPEASYFQQGNTAMDYLLGKSVLDFSHDLPVSAL
eukprot:SM000300S11710  [mRNA]  locus=s300:32268:37747:+ [translate_table: standard]